MSETLADEQGRHLLPSVVHYTKEGVSCIGYEAAEHSTTDPLNTLSSIKRLMGRGINDIKTLGSQLPYTFAEDDGGMPKIITAAGAVSPIQVSAEILRKLSDRAELGLGVFEVLATGGDSALGGDDFDRTIAEWIRQQVGLDESLDPTEQRVLLEMAKFAKEELTDVDSVELELLDWQSVLTREMLNTLIDPMIEKTLRASKKALRDAGVSFDQVHDVVLVGGSTRTPRVREKVEQLFGRTPHTSLDPDLVVAMGAALQADVLVGNKSADDMLLLDVIPLSLGIETMGGLIEKIIHRNTTIPVSKAQEFTTFKDGQTAMAVHILQGERELADDCRSLARFELRGIPPMVAGAAKIRVTYQVDADGLLSVTAKEMVSGVESRIEVKPSYGLKENEITDMLQASFSHAREDMQARALREQQVEAERMIVDLHAALEKDGRALLEPAEYQCLEVAIKELQDVLANSREHRVIARQIESVGKASEEFAARRMNASIKSALAGQSLDDVETNL